MIRPAVLVTGGATRIGAAIVRRFAEAGWHVVIHYRASGIAAEALAATLPSAETIAFDLADDEAAVSAVTRLAARLPDWRCLVNSASVFDYDGVTELDPATNRAAMQINALAPARLAQAFIADAVSPAMRCVIHVTDMKIENTNPDFFSYTMSKHALAATIGMLAKGNQDKGIRVYGLAPGAVLASHDQREEETEISHRLNLLQRKTGADEIADAALLLSSGALESGQSLFIDSGQHLLDQPRDVIWLAREQAQSPGPGASA
ncbi:NAD(P)-dependent dehydrogenase (short-subunit alcohol dehydrogenase family) [Erythromicrobium ramosum]|uniref:NAD(P)-dependent dehydrogenase (Short-subunit alcohol dehydrogenase family) n=1 Tax=Erythrobacter ramosus TaxID=35811 RepID=A0A6I4UJ77_9SPHN|nr:SDR family oxidoreductase [Erythrobacter ramosus]MBB3775735.1 NAD(P)-dependent dehydrogenase (short-subunit alcohol dehydrogenase family) [Erythrobacter ramosus]MXP39171.1 SDR family oxidoreductase [Erythrobacter ramosus]